MISEEFRSTQTFLIDLAAINNCNTAFVNSLKFSKTFSDIYKTVLQSPGFEFNVFSKFINYLSEKMKEERNNAQNHP